ncbi:DMT family transporter [Halothermothrix orenii]|uniref:Predicted permease, DMT superfamily n=1 Tax=Halothermothrix orenii (strain H 168 / OCM 544 / DSM 9562) TaxID=373903 RepID=B8CWE9_HALOH|nr:DMT family transporter [Halothermothrix orenii]ACL69618.1 predicted permease, DMT superfamily [Halothermothrix orenii H 168]
MPNKYLPVISGITFSTIFGFSFMFTKEALDIISPFQLLGYRFATAALVLTLLYVTGLIKINLKGKKLGLLFTLALIQPVLYFVFETLGIHLTTSSEAGLMISLIPVVVAILASIFLKEKPNRVQLFFIILSVVGVAFIMVMKGALSVEKNYFGIFLLLGAVSMAGIYNILSRKLSLNFKPVEITFVMMWFGAIFFNIISFWQIRGNWKIYFGIILRPHVLTSVMYLGILSSVVAFFLVNFTLSRIQSFQSAVFSNLTTVISVMAGIIFRNEPFYWFQIIGAVMIITGVWGTNYYGRNLKKKAEELPA